jgi:hypothetical protein
MAVAKIRKVPSELPHARLYLDDVEELCDILLDAFRNVKKPVYAPPSYSGPAIRFLIADDLEMDTVEDLRRYGGSATKFKIMVKVDMTSWISIDGFTNPTLDTAFSELNESEQWALYSKIKAVFEPRKFVFKNAIVTLPGWLKWSLYVLLTFGMLPVLGLLHAHNFWYAVWGVFGGLIIFVMFRPSRVYFVGFRERSKLLIESRKSWIKAIVLILLGAAGGKLVEYAAKSWVK